jgi:hypothetical protein
VTDICCQAVIFDLDSAASVEHACTWLLSIQWACPTTSLSEKRSGSMSRRFRDGYMVS